MGRLFPDVLENAAAKPRVILPNFGGRNWFATELCYFQWHTHSNASLVPLHWTTVEKRHRRVERNVDVICHHQWQAGFTT